MEITVDGLGTRVLQVLSQDQYASVSGVTSRGLFVTARSGLVLFLSGEAYRGPLTLNLDTTEGIFEGIKPGDPINIQDRNLFFSACDLWISTAEAEEWKPNDPSSVILSPSERQHRLNQVHNQVSTQSGLLNVSKQKVFCQPIHSYDEIKIVEALEPFLGDGFGLTPAGDDLIAGLLLTLNRWGSLLLPGLWLQYINQSIVQAAWKKTTALSASLIECAAQAQADERLILALDSLVTGKPEQARCVACLRGYGSSSGIDAFKGMEMVLTTEKLIE